MAWGSAFMAGNIAPVVAGAVASGNQKSSGPQRMVPSDMNTRGLRSQRSRDVAAQVNAGRAQRRAEISGQTGSNAGSAQDVPAMPVMGLADGGLVGHNCEQTGRLGSLHGKDMKK